MSDEVGKVSLGLELDEKPIGKQISNVTSALASTVQKTMESIFRGFKSAGSGVIATPEVDTGDIKSKISDLTAVMDNVNAKIEVQQRKLADLNEAYENTFSDTRKNKLQEKIINTEGTLLRLTQTSDKTAQKIWELEDKLKDAGKAAGQANKPVEKLGSKLIQADKPLKHLKTNLDKTAKAAVGAGTSFNAAGTKAGKMGNQFTAAFSRVLKQAFVFAVLYKAVHDFNDYLGSSLRTNAQYVASLNAINTNLRVAFQPIYDVILPAINALMSWLAKATAYVAAFISALFGNTYQQSYQAAKGLESAKQSLAGYGKAAKKAGKDAQGSLASFDQLNTLDLSKGGGDSDAGGGGVPAAAPASGSFEMAPPNMDITGIQSKMDALVATIKSSFNGAWDYIKSGWNAVTDLFKSINFDPMINGFDKLRDALEPFKQRLFDGLKWFWDQIITPFTSWTAESLVPAFLDLLSGALNVLNPLLAAFKPVAQFLWDNFLQPIAEWTGGVIVTVLTSLGEKLTEIGNWMSKHQTIVTNITVAVLGFFAAWKLTQLLAFVQASGGIASAFGKLAGAIWAATGAKVANAAQTVYLKVLYAKDLVVSIASAIASLAKKTAAWVANTAAMVANKAALLANKILLAGGFIKSIASATAALVTNIAKWVASTAAMVANKIAMVASTVAQVAMTAAMVAWNVAVAIGTAATTAFNVALAILTSPITLVIAAVAALVAGIILLVKNWDKVKIAASNVWENIKSVWSKAANWFKSTVVTPISNLFKNMFNVLIDGVNFMIRGLNKLSVDVPDWLGGGEIGFSLQEIPKLANGGLARGPTLAMVGDNRGAAADPEVISPLSQLQDMLGANNQPVVEVLYLILEALKSNNQQAVRQIGEMEFGRVAINAINSVQRQAGRTLLNV